jgi:hypothetical protein
MAGIYCRRHPVRSVLCRVFVHYFELFLREYEDRFGRECGYFLPVIQDVVEKCLFLLFFFSDYRILGLRTISWKIMARISPFSLINEYRSGPDPRQNPFSSGPSSRWTRLPGKSIARRPS